jgi:hypothetical protein
VSEEKMEMPEWMNAWIRENKSTAAMFLYVLRVLAEHAKQLDDLNQRLRRIEGRHYEPPLQGETDGPE